MSDVLQTAITVGGFLFTALSTWIGASQFYRQSIKDKQLSIQQQTQEIERLVNERTEAKTKEYAAQRDFNHLKRNLEQLQDGQLKLINELDKTIDKVHNRLNRLEIGLKILTHHVTGESISGMLSSTTDQED